MTANEIKKGDWGLHHLKIYTIGPDVSNTTIALEPALLKHKADFIWVDISIYTYFMHKCRGPG